MSWGGERVGDADRDACASRLSAWFQSGHLDQAEFDRRLSGAMTAATRADLSALTSDLPEPPPAGLARWKGANLPTWAGVIAHVAVILASLMLAWLVPVAISSDHHWHSNPADVAMFVPSLIGGLVSMICNTVWLCRWTNRRHHWSSS